MTQDNIRKVQRTGALERDAYTMETDARMAQRVYSRGTRLVTGGRPGFRGPTSGRDRTATVSF